MKTLLSLFCLLPILCGAQSGIITTIAGNGTAGYSGDGGPATAAVMNKPHGLNVDGHGNIYIVDNFSHAIRKINSAGIISTVAGTGVAGHSGDGGAATAAKIYNPYQVAFDAVGNMYFCESDNYVRKIDTSGVIYTIAGNGSVGSSGDGGFASAATLNWPEGLVIDASGNIYISDYLNNAIRKIDTSGIISLIAGTGTHGYSGDGGPATAAKLARPNYLFIDHSGNLLISDNDNHVIRKVDTSGIITTFAGTGTAGFSGDGGPATAAQLHYPYGVFEDAHNNIFVSDHDNNRIRKIAPSGFISTIAGTGSLGYSGDGGPASSASLNAPDYVYVDNSGDLYISDEFNNVVRKVQFSTTGIKTIESGENVSIYPNPTGDILNVDISEGNYNICTITNSMGAVVMIRELFQKHNVLLVEELPVGVYILTLKGASGLSVGKFVKGIR